MKSKNSSKKNEFYTIPSTKPFLNHNLQLDFHEENLFEKPINRIEKLKEMRRYLVKTSPAQEENLNRLIKI